MDWILLVLRRWTEISLASLVGICAIIAWDWFVMTRFPFARYRVRMSREAGGRAILIREVLRVRRVRVEPGSGPDRKERDGVSDSLDSASMR